MPNVERTAAHHVHVPIDDCEKKSTAAYRNMLYEEVARMSSSRHAKAAAEVAQRIAGFELPTTRCLAEQECWNNGLVKEDKHSPWESRSRT